MIIIAILTRMLQIATRDVATPTSARPTANGLAARWLLLSNRGDREPFQPEAARQARARAPPAKVAR